LRTPTSPGPEEDEGGARALWRGGGGSRPPLRVGIRGAPGGSPPLSQKLTWPPARRFHIFLTPFSPHSPLPTHPPTLHSNETEKRHGAGRGNWGTEGAEGEGGGEGGGGGAPGEEGAPRRERRERRPPVEEDPATAAEREAAAAAAAAEAELEAKQMTLEQYEAAIKDKRAALNKAGGKGATVDASALEGLKPFEKVGVEAAVGLSAGKDIAGTRKSGAGGAAPSALAAGTKPAVATGFRIASGEERPPRDSEGGGRGGRGGRGGGRDGGGRGGGRGRGDSAGAAAAASRGGRTVTSSGPAPAINDSSAFPTLGA